MMLHQVASIKTTCEHFVTLFLEQLYLCLPMKFQHFHVPTSFAVFLIDVNKTRIVTKTHDGNAIIPNSNERMNNAIEQLVFSPLVLLQFR